MPYLFHEMNNLLGKKSENEVNTNKSEPQIENHNL